MKKLITIAAITLLATGCSTLNDYELGCRDGLEVTQMKDTVRDSYCEALRKNRK